MKRGRFIAHSNVFSSRGQLMTAGCVTCKSVHRHLGNEVTILSAASFAEWGRIVSYLVLLPLGRRMNNFCLNVVWLLACMLFMRNDCAPHLRVFFFASHAYERTDISHNVGCSKNIFIALTSIRRKVRASCDRPSVSVWCQDALRLAQWHGYVRDALKRKLLMFK